MRQYNQPKYLELHLKPKEGETDVFIPIELENSENYFEVKVEWNEKLNDIFYTIDRYWVYDISEELSVGDGDFFVYINEEGVLTMRTNVPINVESINEDIRSILVSS